MNAMVVAHLHCELLGGMPFLKYNHITLDIPKNQIIVRDSQTVPFCPPGSLAQCGESVIRGVSVKTVFPGDYIEMSVSDPSVNGDIVVKPMDLSDPLWPEPQLVTCVEGQIRLINSTANPITIRKHQHVAKVTPIKVCNDQPNPYQQEPSAPTAAHPQPPTKGHSGSIIIDPDECLTSLERRSFSNLHSEFDDVFNPVIGSYNDASGRLRASINIGKVQPPTSKTHQPQYERKRLSELQDKMDDLELLGVLVKPEDVGIEVHTISPSFLVGKPDGSSRMVTSFLNLASYARPPPSRSASTDAILIFLAKWPMIIKTDMTSQFFQMKLDKKSMPYAGVATPFKGTRVYARAAMGMPGSTEWLDELIYRVLGDLIHEDVAAKIADDLYVGGSDAAELQYNWRRVLELFRKNNLRLKAPKTVIAPKRAVVLGWILNSGTITVSEHKINPLITASPPTTVKALRSWIGAYKHVKCCISQYSSLLSPLEALHAGRDSKERIQWTPELEDDFRRAQNAFRTIKPVTVPRPSDHLIATSDGSIKNQGLGSVLYILRDGQIHLGGYFSMKLSEHQARWLPCELEALAIASSVNHWQLFIRESHHVTQILTDSRPCVQAAKKLARGEFSASSRVSTFLSTLSRYRINLQHISAASPKLLPADYLSRNPSSCEHQSCQICTFVNDCANSVIRNITVSDVLKRQHGMPFSNKSAWLDSQSNCQDLRRVRAHLLQGTRPSHKATKVKDVKSYLRSCTLATTPRGLIVHRKSAPFSAPLELIVVPRALLHGLITALHLRLNHPTFSQLQKVFDRFFYGLESASVLKTVSEQCAQCSSLKHFPKELQTFTSSPPAPHPGVNFAADVIARAGQRILTVRDTFSSYSIATLISDETAQSIRNGLIRGTAPVISSSGATVRCDGGPGFQALSMDKMLQSHGIYLEMGHCKNVNKNPVAEKCNEELEEELRRIKPDGGLVSETDLAVATRILNSRIRNRGLSAHEIVFQRDQYDGKQFQFSDANLAEQQEKLRNENHSHSAKSKATGNRIPKDYVFKVGNLVHIKGDYDKHVARPIYIIVSLTESSVSLRKMVGSKFRSKVYIVKYSDIFPSPISQANPLNSPPDPIDSDSDDESVDHLPFSTKSKDSGPSAREASSVEVISPEVNEPTFLVPDGSNDFPSEKDDNHDYVEGNNSVKLHAPNLESDSYCNIDLGCNNPEPEAPSKSNSGFSSRPSRIRRMNKWLNPEDWDLDRG